MVNVDVGQVLFIYDILQATQSECEDAILISFTNIQRNFDNTPMDDINPLDVTVAYVSEINKSKTIKCLGYLWLGIYQYCGGPLESLTMKSRDDLTAPFWYGIIHHIQRWRLILINIGQQSTTTH